MSGWPWDINGIDSIWMAALWRACWQGGLTLFLVWAVFRFLPQIPPRAKAWLWRLAFLKLLVTFVWPGSINLPLLPAAAARPVSVSISASMDGLAKPQGLQEVLPSLVRAPAAQAPLVVESRMAKVGIGDATSGRRLPAPLTFGGWLLLMWLAGVGAHLARVGWDGHRACNIRRTYRVISEGDLANWCNDAARRLRVRRSVRLAESERVSQPLLLGLLRPTIVLPSATLSDASPAQLRMILAHELAHAKRMDLGWAWLHFLGQAFFFFHPLVWLGRAESRLAQELACDALAVRAMESSLTEYGRMLLDVAAQPRNALAATRVLSVGIYETKRSLERRLKAMKFIRQNTTRRLWLATACLLGIGAAAVLPWRVVAQSSLAGGDSKTDTQTVTADNRQEIDSLKQQLDDAKRQLDELRKKYDEDRAAKGLSSADFVQHQLEEIVAAREKAKMAAAQAQRMQELLKAKAVSAAEADKAQAELAQAQAQLTRLELRLTGRPRAQASATGEMKVFSLRYANAIDLAKHLQSLNLDEAGDATEGGAPVKTTVVADPRTNSLVVQGSRDALTRVTALIQTLDVTGNASTVETRGETTESGRPLAILAPKPGFVQRVCVTGGQTVKKGDPLVQLDSQDARGKVNNALAQLDIAKASLAIQMAEYKGLARELDRLQGMADKNLVSQGDLEQKVTARDVAKARVAKAEAELKLAEQQVEEAKLGLEQYVVRAPRDGKVSRMRVQVGEYIPATSGQPLMMISP